MPCRATAALLVTLSLTPGAASAASFALACTGPATTRVDGFGVRETRREPQPTTLYVIDDVAKRVAVVAGGRAPNDLCLKVDHCVVEVTDAAISVAGITYLGITRLSSRLAIDRKTGRGVREEVTDHESLDPIRLATPVTCIPTVVPTHRR